MRFLEEGRTFTY